MSIKCLLISGEVNPPNTLPAYNSYSKFRLWRQLLLITLFPLIYAPIFSRFNFGIKGKFSNSKFILWNFQIAFLQISEENVNLYKFSRKHDACQAETRKSRFRNKENSRPAASTNLSAWLAPSSSLAACDRLNYLRNHLIIF